MDAMRTAPVPTRWPLLLLLLSPLLLPPEATGARLHRATELERQTMSVNFLGGALDVRKMILMESHLRAANVSAFVVLTQDERDAVAHVTSTHLDGDELRAYLVHVKEPISSYRLQEIERACEGRLGPYLPHNTYPPPPPPSPSPPSPSAHTRTRTGADPLAHAHFSLIVAGSGSNAAFDLRAYARYSAGTAESCRVVM